MRKTARIALIGLLTFALTIDSATAGHWLFQRLSCWSAPTCVDPCAVSCPSPVYVQSCPPVDDCYSSSTPVEMWGPSEVEYYESMPMESESTDHSVMQPPSDEAEMPQPALPQDDLSPADDPITPIPPADAPFDEPAPLDQPADQGLFDEPADAVEDQADPVAPEQPSGDEGLFDEPVAPADESTGGFFDSDPAEDAMPEVDTGAEAEVPADSTMGLFDEPIETPAVDEPLAPPVEEEAAPVEQPAESEDFGALFGDSADAPPADTQPEVAEPAVDDFFSAEPAEPAAEEVPADDAADAPEDDFGAFFGEPEATGDTPADDLPMDTTPADDVPVEELPADESAPATEEGEDSIEDLFNGFGAVLREDGGFRSHEFRTWVDNTGQYSCQGRLLELRDGAVKLLKANGHTSTLPVGRLSQIDAEFVNRQASALKIEEVSRTARR